MDVEKQVAAYYTRGRLEERILDALRGAGKNLEHLQPADLAAVDNFHVGGREATEDLAAFMELRVGMHLLDVGCGIGGPARYFAERGCQVMGIDLTDEFVRCAESMTRLVKLDRKAKFRRASALELPFDSGAFDGAYEIHAGMNIGDKAGVFREVARVLKRGARFAIFDIMSGGDGPFEFPVPWALGPETSFVASTAEYRQALQAAGFHVEHERERRQFAVEFIRRMMAQASAATTELRVHLLMGEQAPLMLKNVMSAIASGSLEPVELVATVI
jgi:ubiquinone/menaquinone biosynthesis C-methylase UbiE